MIKKINIFFISMITNFRQLVKEKWFNQDQEPIEELLYYPFDFFYSFRLIYIFEKSKFCTQVKLSDQDLENIVIPLERVVFIVTLCYFLFKLKIMINRNKS